MASVPCVLRGRRCFWQVIARGRWQTLVQRPEPGWLWETTTTQRRDQVGKIRLLWPMKSGAKNIVFKDSACSIHPRQRDQMLSGVFVQWQLFGLPHMDCGVIAIYVLVVK